MEQQGMIGALADLIDGGRAKVFAVGSVNQESFYNRSAHPAHRSYVQAQFDAYVRHEVVPFIENHCHTPGIALTTMGASFGAYHAANTLLKHPEIVKRCFALSGIYDLRRFMDGHYDDNFYFNNPIDYVEGLDDPDLSPAPLDLRDSPGHGIGTMGKQRADLRDVGRADAQGDRPSPGRLGKRRRARLAVLAAPDACVPRRVAGRPRTPPTDSQVLA